MTLMVSTDGGAVVDLDTKEGSYIYVGNFLKDFSADSRVFAALAKLYPEAVAESCVPSPPAEEVQPIEPYIPDVEKKECKTEIVVLNLDEAKELLERAPVTALDILAMDQHTFSARPCQTCATISKLIKQPFGCTKL